MAGYFQFMDAEQRLWLAAALAMLPFLVWMVVLQRKYSIPFPPPLPMPRPLPPGWSSYLLASGFWMLVCSICSAVATYRQYSDFSDMEQTGGRIRTFRVLLAVYEMVGPVGFLLSGLGLSAWIFWMGVSAIRQSRIK